MTTGLEARPRCSYCGALARPKQRACVVCGRALSGAAASVEVVDPRRPESRPASSARATEAARLAETLARVARGPAAAERQRFRAPSAGASGELRVVLVLLVIGVLVAAAWLFVSPALRREALRPFVAAVAVEAAGVRPR